MKIPEPLQETVKKFIEKDPNLRTMVGLATLVGNTPVISSITKLGVAASIEQVINPDPLYPPPTDEQFSGPILFGQGTGFTPRRDKKDLILHYGCRGTTGSGKSSQSIYLARQFAEQNIKFINLEFKRDVCGLCREMPLLNFGIGPEPNSKLNLFQGPPGGHATVWDAIITKVFGITQYIADAGQNLMLDALTRLREEGTPVTIFTLHERIKRTKMKSSRGFSWRESLVNRCGGLISTCGALLDVPPGYHFPLEKIVEVYPLNFQFDQVTSEYSSLLAAYPILYLYCYRIFNNLRVGSSKEPPLIVFMCDESASLINKGMEMHGLGEHPITQLIRLAREFNFAFMLWSNSSFPKSLREQINLKGLQRVVDFEGIRDMAQDMGLPPEALDIIRDLPPGDTILKFPEIQPFLSYFPHVPLRKDISRGEIDENNRALLQGTEFEYILWPEKKSVAVGEDRLKKEPEKKEVEIEVTPEEKALLMHIFLKPWLSITERYDDVELDRIS